MKPKKSKARYIAAATKEAVFVTDLDDGAVSVTNDADLVVLDMLAMYPGRRIIYRDTMGNWDELCHDGKSFTNFAPLDRTDRDRYAPYL